MHLPISVKNDLLMFHRTYQEQVTTRTIYKLKGFNKRLSQEMQFALAKLLLPDYPTAVSLIEMRHEFDRFGDGLGFEIQDLARDFFQKFEMEPFAELESRIKEFVGDHPELVTADTPNSGPAFSDPTLEKDRLALVAARQAALSNFNAQELGTALADRLGVRFVPDADYDALMIEEVTASEQYKINAGQPAKMNAGSDPDLRNALAKTDYTINFYAWQFFHKPIALMQSNKGLLSIPKPGHRLDDPNVRFWPSGEIAFPLETTVARKNTPKKTGVLGRLFGR